MFSFSLFRLHILFPYDENGEASTTLCSSSFRYVRSESQACWHTLLSPALGRQRQMDLCEFKANLVYRESSRTARVVTQRYPVSKIKNKK